MTQQTAPNRSILVGTIVAAAAIGGLLIWSASQTAPEDHAPAGGTAQPNRPPAAEPPPPAAPGMAEVTARVEQLLAEGCTILQEPTPVKGTTAWSPRFQAGDDAPCLNLVAATGNPKITLYPIIRKPDGEKIEEKSRVSMLDYIYCSETEGPHSVNVLCPSNDRYSFAAVSCDRAASLARQSGKKEDAQ